MIKSETKQIMLTQIVVGARVCGVCGVCALRSKRQSFRDGDLCVEWTGRESRAKMESEDLYIAPVTVSIV